MLRPDEALPVQLSNHVICLKLGSSKGNPHYTFVSQEDCACWKLDELPPPLAECWRSSSGSFPAWPAETSWVFPLNGPRFGNCCSPFVKKYGFSINEPGGESGDCFYSCFSQALATCGVHINTEELRMLVASWVDEDVLASYCAINDCEDSFRCDPEHLLSVSALKSHICDTGGMWADEMAISVLLNYTGLAGILLIDVKAPGGRKGLSLGGWPHKYRVLTK